MNRNRFLQQIFGGLPLLLIGLSTHPTAAQGVFGIRSQPDRQQAGAGVGLEPELTASIGYSYRTSRLTHPLQLRVGAGLTLPPYQISQGSIRLNGLVALDWQPTRQTSRAGWSGRLTVLPYYARNRNDAGILDGLGWEVRLLPLRRSDRWTGGFDLGWLATLLTYVRHSDRTKETFTNRYVGTSGSAADQPRDGWYRNTAHRFRLGYTGAWAMGRRVSGQFSAGTLLTLQQQGILLSFAHGQVPVYLETTVNIGW